MAQQMRATAIRLPAELMPVAQEHREFLAGVTKDAANQMWMTCGRNRQVVRVLALMIEQLMRDADYLDAPGVRIGTVEASR